MVTHPHKHYAGRQVALLTQHGKQALLNDAFQLDLGCSLHLAQLFMKTGRTAEARTELKRAISETKGMESAAVAELRNKINQQLSVLP